MTSDFSRRKFLQTSAIAAGRLFASNANAIALEPANAIRSEQDGWGERPPAVWNYRCRDGGCESFIQRDHASGSRMRRRGGPL